MLTLDKFEEASEKVKEVTTETKLVYSDYFSQQSHQNQSISRCKTQPRPVVESNQCQSFHSGTQTRPFCIAPVVLSK